MPKARRSRLGHRQAVRGTAGLHSSRHAATAELLNAAVAQEHLAAAVVQFMGPANRPVGRQYQASFWLKV